MKVEILEKVGEITISCLRPAEANNAIASVEAARKAEIARIEKERKEQEAMVRTTELLAIIVEEINKAAEKGSFSVDFEWTEKSPKSKNILYHDWEDYFDRCANILEQMGYKHYTHWYSKSWRTRSGRIGYASIHW